MASSCELVVRVQPRASRDKVEAEPDGAIKAWVTASPTDGQANEAVRLVLAKALSVPRSAVALVSGQKSRLKRFSIEGLDGQEALVRLLG